MELSHTRGQSMVPSNRLVQMMRRHPLFFYFLIALGFSWAYDLTVMMFVHLPIFPWGGLLASVFTFGPTLAAFLMMAVTQGRAGIRQLLRRYVLWRVGIPWYLFVLLGIPALMLIAVLLLPGALAAFHLPGLSLLPTYLIGSLLFLVGGGSLGEEGGWRGFALPRLEQRSGPLVGTLLLGVLWGLWHLPQFFTPGTSQYVSGIGFVGTLISFFEFDILTIALAVIMTWVFNNTRGSIGLSILLHTSINAASSFLLPQLFPSLAGTLLIGLSMVLLVLVFIVVALLVIVATRGRLSYEHYQRETALPAPGTDREQEKGEAGTSV